MNLFGKSVTACIRQKKCGGLQYLHQTLFSTGQQKITEEYENSIKSQTSDRQPILHRDLNFCPKHLTPRQVWVENLDDIFEKKKGLVELHPKIFGVLPRLDLIFDNVLWQRKYQNVLVYSAKVTAEMKGGGAKPRPQKGTGKSRQGSIRAPQFLHGGTCHGPRNPTSYFYMLPWEVRLHGLISTLSAKFAQDDLHVVDNLDIPTDDSQFILDLIKERNWGPSVLLVDVDDIMPRNITLATDSIGHVNLMPVYSVNVIGMLKHDTLVLTLAAVEEIEKRLVTLLNTCTPLEITKKFSCYPK